MRRAELTDVIATYNITKDRVNPTPTLGAYTGDIYGKLYDENRDIVSNNEMVVTTVRKILATETELDNTTAIKSGDYYYQIQGAMIESRSTDYIFVYEVKKIDV